MHLHAHYLFFTEDKETQSELLSFNVPIRVHLFTVFSYHYKQQGLVLEKVSALDMFWRELQLQKYVWAFTLKQDLYDL